MRNSHHLSLYENVDKGRPDYYITPTRDFTKYTKDCEEKYWSKDTAFDWNQNVQDNLKAHLENLVPEQFSKIAFMTLPMVEKAVARKIEQIRQMQLPAEEDALKSIRECIPFGRTAIEDALSIQSPLMHVQVAALKMKDQLEILQSELLDLLEQQRLGFFKTGIQVKHLETVAEREEQQLALSHLTNQIILVKEQYRQIVAHGKVVTKQLEAKIQAELHSIEHQVLTDLEATQVLLRQTLHSNVLPQNPNVLAQLKDLILKRQLRGLKDIANHALVVEQSAIAPLTIGIIHYKRYREIQEAMTTFINDEAKHSATFRRFLAEKLEAKEYIPAKLIKGANRYMWLARFMPSAGAFFAVVVEAVGAAVLEFFGNEQYMPDTLFCSICKKITEQDEVRHLDLCVDMYNELFRRSHRWEKFRNNIALKLLMKSVYGDKTEDHHLIQAFHSFGVESHVLYQHTFTRVSEQLARISMYVEPERLLAFIGR